VPVDGNRNRLVANAAAGIAQTILSGLLMVLLYRFLLDRLGPGVVGEWSLMVSIFGLARILELGLSGSGLKMTAQALAAGDHPGARAYARISIAGTALLTLPGIVAGIFTVPLLLGTVGITSSFEDIWVLGAIGAAIWIGFVLQALRSVIDAFQRVDLRHLTVVVQGICLLGACWVLIPVHGWRGLVVAFLLASGATAVLSAAILRRLWSTVPSTGSTRDRRALVRDMLKYGMPFQVTGIAALLYDPFTKYLLGRFGSLEAIAWYELASRLALLLRSLMVSAMEALVPYVARLDHADPRVVVEKYLATVRLSLSVGVPQFMALLASAPFLAWIWIGSPDPQFIGFLQLLSVTWMISMLSAPAYFFSLGLGRQRWNLAAHVLSAVLNLVLSSLLGAFIGPVGVVIGFSLAILIGAILQTMGFHRERGIGIIPLCREPAASWACAAIGASVLVGALWWVVPEQARFPLLVIGFCLAVLLALAPLRNPLVGARIRAVCAGRSGGGEDGIVRSNEDAP
jgi:O-antigen/teichoic acid export membrane protein